MSRDFKSAESQRVLQERIKVQRFFQDMAAFEPPTKSHSNNSDTHENKIIDQESYSMEMNSMTPGQRLRLWRKNHNLTMTQLSKLLGVSQATISHFEADRVNLTSKTLEHLGELGLDINWLLCGKFQCFYTSEPQIKELSFIAEDLDPNFRASLLDYAEYLKAKQVSTLTSEKNGSPKNI